MTEFEERWPWLRMKPDTQTTVMLSTQQYLFTEPAADGKRSCWCSACGNRGTAAIYGKERTRVMCPFCYEMVTVINHRRFQKDAPTLQEWVPVMWFQRHDGELWAAYGWCRRSFYRESWDGPDWSQWLNIQPERVYRFRVGETAEMWKWSAWYGWPTSPWNASDPQLTRMFGNGRHVYDVYQTGELEESALRYSGLDQWLEDGIREGMQECTVARYLAAYCRKPGLELAVKWGLNDVVRDLVYSRKTNGRSVRWDAKTPWEFLKISRADWKAYRESRCASVELLQQNRKTFHMPVPELLEIEDCYLAGGNYSDWQSRTKILCEKGIPVREQVRYIRKQEKLSDRTPSAWLRLWVDYLTEAEKAGRDVSINGAIMPRDLQTAHDDMVELNRLNREQLREQAQQRQIDQLNQGAKKYGVRRETLRKKYEYRSGGLMIRVPEEAGEIIREGNVLRICVGGYAARHLSGATTILFLRRVRKPNTPYVCIEINEKTNQIVQIHGYRNEWLGGGKRNISPGEKYRDFLSEWLSWVRAGSKRPAGRKEDTA